MALELLAPVLDGNDPKGWQIWNSTFEQIRQDFDQSTRWVPPDFATVDPVRLIIQLQSDEELFKRTDKQWKRIVAVLVDGGGDEAMRAAMKARVLKLCDALRIEDAWYRRLNRFHIGVLVPTYDSATGNAQAKNFAYSLKESCTKFFPKADVNWDVLVSRDDFMKSLQAYEVALLNSLLTYEISTR